MSTTRSTGVMVIIGLTAIIGVIELIVGQPIRGVINLLLAAALYTVSNWSWWLSIIYRIGNALILSLAFLRLASGAEPQRRVMQRFFAEVSARPAMLGIVLLFGIVVVVMLVMERRHFQAQIAA